MRFNRRLALEDRWKPREQIRGTARKVDEAESHLIALALISV